MKDKRQKQKEKAKIINQKLKEKKEHLQDIKKEQEKKRKKLENKIVKMTQKQEIFEKKRELGFDRMRRTRNELFKRIQNNKKQLQKEEVLRRKDILFEENNRLGRLYNSQNAGKSEISNIQTKTLILSKEDYELRKEFLKKLRYAISGYFDDFKVEHPKDNAEFNIIKKKKLIDDLKELKKVIETEFPEFSSDCVYYDKLIDLINGKEVSNLTEMDIYKFGKTTMPSNIDANYMNCLGHEIIKTNEVANKT